MSDNFQSADLFSGLEYYSPSGEYAVRQVQIGPNNHFDKIEIVDVKQRKVLFTLPDEVTYVTGSEYEGELGWRGENDLYLFVLKGCINQINSLSTNEIIHISLKDKAIVERYKLLAKVGDVICRSSDGTCYVEVSGTSRITVYFKETKCSFNGVTPVMGHPSLARWSPDCSDCCFMGKYDSENTRLIHLYIFSEGKAEMDAWNLGRIPDDVEFEERKDMSYLCVPILQGQKIYKKPFYYDDSIYVSAVTTSRFGSQPLPESSTSCANPISEVKSEQINSADTTSGE